MRDSTRHEKVEEAPGILDEPGLFGPYKFIRLKSGRKIIFTDAIGEAESGFSTLMRGMSRGFKLMSTEWDLDMLERRLDHLEEYCRAIRKHIEDKRGEKVVRERIAQLRNTEGRTPEEAELYRAKADELEASLRP